jgi:hypothetical protein
VLAGHEVVEARRNGVPFLFKRKRSSAAPPAAQPHPPRGPAASAGTRSHLLRTPAGAAAAAQAATAAAAAESPYADELELPRALGQRLVQGMQQLAERAAPAERLAAIADSLGGAAVQEAACTSAARAAVLADVFAAFRARLEQALASGVVALGGGGGHQPPPAHDEGEVEQPGYQVDLQARKAGLRARLANFQKVRQGRRRGARHIAGQQSRALASSRAARGLASAPVKQTLSVRPAPQTCFTVCAVLHPPSPLQEEAEWQSLLQQVEALDQTQLAAAPPQLEQDAAREAGTAAAAGTDAGQPAAAGPGAEGAPAGAAAAESGELAALAAARTSLHRALALQVGCRRFSCCAAAPKRSRLRCSAPEVLGRAAVPDSSVRVLRPQSHHHSHRPSALPRRRRWRACASWWAMWRRWWSAPTAALRRYRCGRFVALLQAGDWSRLPARQLWQRLRWQLRWPCPCSLLLHPGKAAWILDVLKVAEQHAKRCTCCLPLLQAEFLSEHLAAFPHVHSPARLIRELVRPAGGSKPAAAAAPDSKPAAAAAAEPAGGKENAAAPA